MTTQPLANFRWPVDLIYALNRIVGTVNEIIAAGGGSGGGGGGGGGGGLTPIAGTNISITFGVGTFTINATGIGVNGMLPLVTGDLPGPVLIADADGQCIGVPL